MGPKYINYSLFSINVKNRRSKFVDSSTRCRPQTFDPLTNQEEPPLDRVNHVWPHLREFLSSIPNLNPILKFDVSIYHRPSLSHSYRLTNTLDDSFVLRLINHVHQMTS